jgi:hypothetical protein
MWAAAEAMGYCSKTANVISITKWLVGKVKAMKDEAEGS